VAAGSSPAQKWGVDTHDECGVRTEFWGRAPPPKRCSGTGAEADNLKLLDAQRKRQLCHILRILETGESVSNSDRPPAYPSPDLHQSQEQSLAKVGMDKTTMCSPHRGDVTVCLRLQCMESVGRIQEFYNWDRTESSEGRQGVCLHGEKVQRS